MYAQKNAKRGICTPCPMHPFPVLSCCLFLAALAPRQSETAVGGVTASSVSSCGMGKESRALGVIPGTLTKTSSEPAPWRDLGGLEIHVILPQP